MFIWCVLSQIFASHSSRLELIMCYCNVAPGCCFPVMFSLPLLRCRPPIPVTLNMKSMMPAW